MKLKAEKKVGLVVAADEPALFFSSIEAAEAKLEAIDVEDGVYPVAYDPEGRPYILRSEGLGRFSAGRVCLEPQSTEPQPEALRQLLLRALAYDPAVSSEWSLAELLQRAARDLSD